ncbi:TPA: hypothetical protein ACSE38_003407 [Acinetobacter baumannii]|jgi:hypothetical protein|uniref:Uncharacterized protein n=11 Tax=Gammaproteobacteria TaxID=1236 RepID=A0A059ZJE3_ACIBA|nr:MULTISPECIES: hypothetical protein [Acinetobacter]AHX27993.1 hypothetical protein A478_05270 [Acinetobacter baumannii AC12]AHX63800.1 hypothetical protein B856_00690 [Acinetobacter baumannii AC30]EMT91046.1 hypothetical protein ABNIH5_08076 [Acinetobacter baumannii ABNIH5]ETY68099.1 hypothetical protein X964_12075 [Acinetobacter baumannii MDR_MMC4]EXB12815.1 putative membrane protein [Acinetobacter baumannii 1397084]EXC94107.1 putative membrane protein [Acinetobacter baumannii 1051830]EXD
MLGFLKIMLPLLLVVFLLMGIWVSILHFPWEWMTYVVMGIEVFVATLILPLEYQTGTSSSHIGFISISACLAVLLGIARLFVWTWVKFFA